MRITRYILIPSLCALAACGSDSNMPWDKQNDDAPPASTAPAPIPIPSDSETQFPTSRLSNLPELVEQLNLSAYHRKNYHGAGVKVAILDNGFAGLKDTLGKTLPPGLSVPKTSGNAEADTNHGTKLAELVYALATGRATYVPGQPGPTLLLLNTNGFTNLRLAINKVIEERVDIVLYSQVWEYGGNFDGEGFINREVNRALAAGVLWVNAAGNYGNTTYNSQVQILSDDKVKLPFKDRYIRFSVDNDNTPVKIVLSWNDFSDSFVYRSQQNLDLHLESETGNILASSKLIQDGRTHGPREQGYSDHAREIIRATLKKGVYYISVDAKSNNFTSNSQMRISIDGFGTKILDASAEQDSVMIPADNPHVLTIGASDVDFTGKRLSKNKIAKPDVLTPSIISFDNGESYAGSSTAAAVAAGALTVYRSTFGYKSETTIKREINERFLARFAQPRPVNAPASNNNNGRPDDVATPNTPQLPGGLILRLPAIR